MFSPNFWVITTVLACIYSTMLLFGFNISDIKLFFNDNVFLSAWMQAIGSLAAVWATFYIFRKDLKIKSNEKKLLNELNELKGEAFIVNKPEIREWLNNINKFVERDEKNSTEKNPLVKAIASANYFNSLIIKPLSQEDFDVLFAAFGVDIIYLQRAVVKFDIFSSNALRMMKEIDAPTYGNAGFFRELSNNTNTKNIINSYGLVFSEIKNLKAVSNKLMKYAHLF